MPKFVLLQDFFESYYLPLKLRSRSRNTIRLYRHSVRSFGKFLDRPAKLTDLTDDTVSAYLAWLVSRKLSPYTVNKERSQLLAIWNYAARKGHVATFPDVQPERVPQRVPQAWTTDELSRLIESCRSQSGDVCGVPAADWWTALHLVIWDTAERIGAVLQLTWRGYQQPWLLIPAETSERVAGKTSCSSSARTLKPQSSGFGRRGGNCSSPGTAAQRASTTTTVSCSAGPGSPTMGAASSTGCDGRSPRYYESNGGNATELLGHTSRQNDAELPRSQDRQDRPTVRCAGSAGVITTHCHQNGQTACRIW
jgi:hypothetical protein